MAIGTTAAIVGAGGALAMSERQDVVGAVPSAAISAPSAVVPGTERAGARVIAARRAQVMRTSRGYDRDALGTDARLTRAAERDAAARAQTISEQYEAAAARSAQIEREIERREAQQRREARQRRIAWLNRWVAPVYNYEITATFGSSGSLWSADHTGLDFAAPEGTPVMATAAGEVTSTTYDSAYGNQIVVTHDDGTETWYCHLSSFSVSPGESVAPSETIGAVGSTGNTTGPHLHLEVHPYGGAAVDPYWYLQERGAL
jgi:murein DD-endopeptidase MepM/ murein hydrolase activator NlpD